MKVIALLGRTRCDGQHNSSQKPKSEGDARKPHGAFDEGTRYEAWPIAVSLGLHYQALFLLHDLPQHEYGLRYAAWRA